MMNKSLMGLKSRVITIVIVVSCWSNLCYITPTCSTGTQVSELVLLCPQSSELVDWVIDGFETWYTAEGHGNINVSVLYRSSSDCFDLVSNTWHGVDPEADVWWAYIPYFFELARESDLLHAYTVVENENIPDYFGGWSLKRNSSYYSDPVWYAISISGNGIVYNTEYLVAEDLNIPLEWDDLTDYSYYGHIIMENPYDSVFTAFTLVMILQEKCNQTSELSINEQADITEAWEFWAKVAGNVDQFVASCPDIINEGNYGVGICIDFLAYDIMRAGNTAVGFNFGEASTFTPSPAGIIKGTNNLDEAKLLLDYLTSTEGQTRIGVYRTPTNVKATTSYPVSKAFNDDGSLTGDFPLIEPFNITHLESLYNPSRTLFRSWLVQNHQDVKKAWSQINTVTEPEKRESALALYTKLPSNFNGTIASLVDLDYEDNAVNDLWRDEGATNFGEAFAIVTQPANGGILQFTFALVATISVGSAVIYVIYRKKRKKRQLRTFYCVKCSKILPITKLAYIDGKNLVCEDCYSPL
ncbi:MAG: ABC transporter substrate-binding protein [Candidatus Hodarchaeales archaeon]|jgi:ABC-type Fe3+ transport system substrate-binding protein